MVQPLKSESGNFRSVMASVDKEGHRRQLEVRLGWGFWRKARVFLAIFLIGFYLIAPFVRIGGLPLIRIDIPQRQYILLGQVFWPQDFFYFLLILLCVIIGTVAGVSLMGRVFCGWFCPHNVFLEMVYRPLERLIMGSWPQRRRMSRENPGALSLRNFAYFMVVCVVSGALANAGTAIFVGSEAFVAYLFINPIEHPSAAVFFIFFFVLCVFNFYWFREQMCTIVCPYGRIQSALLDQETLVVGYDYNRGEPRGKKGRTEGDCVDCKACVQVCPTGIDIRNGSQMECLHCAACIDACDAIMLKVGQKPGLIRYTSENELEGKKWSVIRPRTVLYLIVLMGLCTATAVAIFSRPMFDVTRLRDSFHSTEMGEVIRRPVTLALTNKTAVAQGASVNLPEELGGRVIAQYDPLPLPANGYATYTVHIEVPKSSFSSTLLKTELTVAIGDEFTHGVPFALVIPEKKTAPEETP